MPMKVATNRIPNIYELFYDKNGDLLKSPDTIRFKAQDNYSNLLIINLEDGIEDDSLVLINFTPKNAVINYTTHWFYVRPLRNVREVIIEGENTPRVFTSYVYEVPRIVLNNNAKDTAIENTMTIVKRYGFNSVGVFNNYSSLINSHPANVELYDTNGFAYILNDETVGGVLRKKGYYQVIEKTPNNYEWTIRENVMNYGLEQKQYETKKAFVERGYANVNNVPNVEGTVIEALWRDLSIIINDINDLKAFYDLELVLEETNTILGEISKINESYFVIKNNVKIDELENDLLETSINGLYVKHDDTKVDKTTYDQDVSIIREDIIDLEERVDTLELNETALTGRVESLENQVDINTNDIVDLDERVENIEETIDGLNLLVKIDNDTITRNSNQEIQVSEEVINDINLRTKNTDFVAYQQLVQNFLNGKLDKKPDGIIDLITPLNKIDARYLDIDTELFIVVLSLPAIGIPNKIYLVPKSESETQNLYDEFIYLENKWEKLGTITIDLSNYYNKQDIDALLINKVDKVSGKGLSTNDFTNVLKDKLEGIEAGAEVNPYSKTQLDSKFDSKVDISKQVPKTPDMINPVGVDAFGRLWVAPKPDTIIKVREMGSLNATVSYEGNIQPNLTHVDNGDFRVYSNTFDDIFPFNEMKEVSDEFNNKFITIPPIYFKFYYDINNNITGYDISNKKIDNNYKLFPIHEKGTLMIGKYQAYTQSGKLTSISGVEPTMSKPIASYRTEATAVGNKYFANDWQSWNILQLLLTAYFGTTNSDLYFPDINGVKTNTGTMDGYKTSYNITSGKNTFFGIENILKNGYHFIDGVINNDSEVLFAKDYTKYSNTITSDYELKGNKPVVDGYIKSYGGGIGMFPTINTGASSTTYYCDFMYQNTGLRVLLMGSSWDAYAYLGVWLWNAHHAFSFTYSYLGSRLIKYS